MHPEDSPAARRRSPGWVRALTSVQVHALALRLRREAFTDGITERQEWLFTACISELEYRFRAALRQGRRPCVCELCLPWDSETPGDDG